MSTAHACSARWPEAKTSTTASYFWAQCDCGWSSKTAKKLATAEKYVQAHLAGQA
jgi:hypothetical protein